MYLPFRFQNASWQWYTYLQQMLNLKWHTIVLLTNRWNIQLHSIISPRRSSWIRFVTVSYMCTKCRLDIIFGLSTFLFLKQDTAYDYLRTPDNVVMSIYFTKSRGIAGRRFFSLAQFLILCLLIHWWEQNGRKCVR